LFTFINGVSIGIVLGVVMWLIGQRLGKAIVGTPSASHNTASTPCPKCGERMHVRHVCINDDCSVFYLNY